MNKRRKLIFLLSTLMLILVCFSLLGCSGTMQGCSKPQDEHTYGNWAVTKQPTCTEDGVETRICIDCGVEEIRAIAKENHEGGTATCCSKAICANCNSEYGDFISDTHEGGIKWFKTSTKHYEGYECCGLATSLESDHVIDGGICTVCGYNPQIIISNQTVSKTAEKITLKISVEDNPGIIALEITVNFDDTVLNLISVSSGEAMKDFTFTPAPTLENGSKFIWDTIEISDKDVLNGEILILEFEMADSIKTTDYIVSMTVKAYDNDMNSVSFKQVNGKITVTA